MRLGIIGLPASGKTTVFNALTGSDLPTGVSGGRVEVHTAVVEVPDERVEALRARFQPRKITRARVTYADIGGLRVGLGREGLPGELLNHLQAMDAFVHVVRAFEDPTVPHPAGEVDPRRDLETLEAEFLLHDMLVVERRLERLEELWRKGGGDRAALERERALFQRLQAHLEAERPLRTLGLSPEEVRDLAGFGLLTLRPVLVVVNLGEGQEAPALEPPDEAVRVVPLQAKLEMEIAQLPPEEAQAFLAEYGIERPGRERVVRESYDLLGLISFFTLNEEELRAWTLRRGQTALEAAGTIHTDMARGFIRAEVLRWDELIEAGGLAEARAQGRLRVEGKDYVVQDGDVLHIRFNV